MKPIVIHRRGLLRAAGAAAGLATLTACDKLGQAVGLREGFRGMDLGGADYGRDFNLLDTHGQRRTLADFRGKVVMLYFGFTQCPDVCPTALTRAVQVKNLLGADGARFQVIFVTVDPERDQPDLLDEYMAAFDASFIALRPTPEELKKTAADFKIFYRKVPTGSSYTMDHSAQSYLFDPQGRLRVMLRHEQTAQDYAHDAKLLLTEPPG
ncbi:MAG: SCO family protein [Burkholderiaceae bacterium]|jgi:protein SCO1/2|nr:SCO family protein [Burkholderiaceae bacterium]